MRAAGHHEQVRGVHAEKMFALWWRACDPSTHGPGEDQNDRTVQRHREDRGREGRHHQGLCEAAMLVESKRTETKTTMATRAISIPEREQISHLCDDIGAIVSVGRQEVRKIGNKLKWLVGEAVVTSPLYKKYSKGQGGLIRTLAEQLNVAEKSLRDWVRFSEAFPAGKYDLDAPWGKIRAALPAPKGEEQQSTVVICRHCPKHCPEK